MIRTNKTGILPTVADAIWNIFTDNEHRKGTYSATELIKSPRQYFLSLRHDDEIEVDVADLFKMVFGTVFALMLKHNEAQNALQEEYLTVQINGKTISGTIDQYQDGKLNDAKVTSLWNVQKGTSIPDWEKQLNIYAFMLTAAGFNVDELWITAFIRDWKAPYASSPEGYPQSDVVAIPIRKWENEETELFIYGRMDLFESVKNCHDDKLPLCSDEETWSRPNTFAVKKVGGKRALKVYETLDEANAEVKEDQFIETRRGERTKCARFCFASKFCNQYAEYQASLKGDFYE